MAARRAPLSLSLAIERLKQAGGAPGPPPTRDPWLAILRENAAYLVDDGRREQTFRALRERVGTTPEAILGARPGVIEKVIEGGGMQPERRAEKLRQCARLAQSAGLDAVAAAAQGAPDERRARALLKRGWRPSVRPTRRRTATRTARCSRSCPSCRGARPGCSRRTSCCAATASRSASAAARAAAPARWATSARARSTGPSEGRAARVTPRSRGPTAGCRASRSGRRPRGSRRSARARRAASRPSRRPASGSRARARTGRRAACRPR